MKKIILLFLAPLLMATQCDSDEPVYKSEFYIENSSSVDLIYLTSTAREFVIKSQSRQFIATPTSLDFFVPPSGSLAFNEITLYQKDSNGNLFAVYKQEPIEDDLWVFDQIGEYNAEYILIISDEDLN